jgi:hypothetical protein
MQDVGVLSLLVRMVVSLAIVLAIVAVAYVVARSRRGMGSGRIRPARTSSPRTDVAAGNARIGRGRAGLVSAGRSIRRSNPPAIEVVGRAGLTRNSAAVAVRFGDRVVLVSASEHGSSTVLADMDAERWDDLHVDRGRLVAVPRDPAATDSTPVDRPRFLDALREATIRRA